MGCVAFAGSGGRFQPEEVNHGRSRIFFRARALPGKAQAVAEQMDKWQREQKPQAKGYVRSILVANNNNADEIMGAVRFDSAEGYFANASRPEQDAWFRELRALLAADPEWFDGTLLREFIA